MLRDINREDYSAISPATIFKNIKCISKIHFLLTHKRTTESTLGKKPVTKSKLSTRVDSPVACKLLQNMALYKRYHNSNIIVLRYADILI